jgi:hypothetical protein
MSARGPGGGQPFVPRVAADAPGGTAARWWNEALADADRISRRRALAWQLGIGGVAIAGVTGIAVLANRESDEVDGSMDALELQRRTSWNVGDTDRRLQLANLRTTDVDGSVTWQGTLQGGHLAEALAPAEARLQPYYAPALFQAPDRSPDLRQVLMPILRPSMEEFYDRGRALADAFDAAGRPHDTALVIDLHGPEAVAVAAGIADQFAPVFTFDNWPHPRGVVPSHETLAAALYYLPALRRAADGRQAPAPPAFVLDADRLNPYRDEVEHFDNRYTVSLPSASRLQSLGVARLLYVRGGAGALESDDLNADFAELERSGIPVRLVSLADFQPAAEEIKPVGTTAARPVAAASKTPDAGVAAAAGSTTHRHYTYYGGGYHWSHVYFWHQYGWYAPAPPRGAPPRMPPAPAPSRAASYRPVARQTMFSSRTVGGVAGIGKAKPSGFGRVSVRTSRSSGAISVGRGRSGSYGRGSSFSG